MSDLDVARQQRGIPPQHPGDGVPPLQPVDETRAAATVNLVRLETDTILAPTLDTLQVCVVQLIAVVADMNNRLLALELRHGGPHDGA